MKAQHKNSLETFDLSEPRYTKLNGLYGYLVMSGKQIFFISIWNDDLFKDDLTEDFTVL